MTIEELRAQIDEADRQLLAAFAKRMETAAQIADYKHAHHLPVLDSARERQKLADVTEQAAEAVRPYVGTLYHLLFALSRLYQGEKLTPHSALEQRVLKAAEQTEPLFPRSARVACQSAVSDLSQLACERLFSSPDIQRFNTLDAVFSAVERGICRYGVIPAENGTAGPVSCLYDLMMQHGFSIVRSVRVKADRPRPAGAERCGPQYPGSGVQDSESGGTRFFCISKNLEIYSGADRTSLMLVLPHRTGSLYQVLSRLYALGINLLKLESRSLPGRDLEATVYLDLEISVRSPAFARMLRELEQMAQPFRYLGSYGEIV